MVSRLEPTFDDVKCETKLIEAACRVRDTQWVAAVQKLKQGLIDNEYCGVDGSDGSKSLYEEIEEIIDKSFEGLITNGKII